MRGGAVSVASRSPLTLPGLSLGLHRGLHGDGHGAAGTEASRNARPSRTACTDAGRCSGSNAMMASMASFRSPDTGSISAPRNRWLACTSGRAVLRK